MSETDDFDLLIEGIEEYIFFVRFTLLNFYPTVFLFLYASFATINLSGALLILLHHIFNYLK